jgi:DNA repair protein RadD
VTDLRPYQSQAIQDLELAISDAQAPLYVLPTGAGKTVVAAQIIERAVASGKRVLVLTHRREILKQTSLKLSGGDFEWFDPGRIKS